jgi:type II secretory ATPase GspE/PulE/Tfp pilus assembly ATPase PilB-like protein
MIGEIRDRESLQIGIQAALTGHLVFTTLHTNNAVETISRMTDMGAEDYLIAATLVRVMAQRLVPIIFGKWAHRVAGLPRCGSPQRTVQARWQRGLNPAVRPSFPLGVLSRYNQGRGSWGCQHSSN